MAITIQSNPGNYFSAQGDLIFTVVEWTKAFDAVTYPDYRYVADVYVGATLVARLKAYPQPDNGIGVFNIGNIVRNYIEVNFNPASGLRAQEMGSGEFFITVTVKFGEEYNFTLTTNITVDSARVYFNHYNGRLIGQTTNLAALVDKPLTSRTTYTNVLPFSQGYPVYTGNSNNFVPYLPTDTDQVTLRIRAYSEDGTQLSTNDQNYTPSAANTLQLFNLSPTVINAAFPGAIDTSASKYYTVQFLNPNISDDQIIKFDLVCEPKYTVYTLHFLNKWGSFESRDFTKVSRKAISIEKTEFGQIPYELNASGVVSYYNSNKVYRETRSIFSSQFKEKMTLNTDILSDADYNWLGELILSPLVYIEIDTYSIPCAIVQNDYEYRKRINDQLTNLTLSIEFGDQFNAQFR